MMSYWSEFARSGRPGRGRDGALPEWASWGLGDGEPKLLVLDTEPDGGIRMSNEALTADGLIARLEQDSRLRAKPDRCALYYSFARRGRGLDEAGYARLCAEFPMAEHPWTE
jgi:para-nitrobenzyl esterase